MPTTSVRRFPRHADAICSGGGRRTVDQNHRLYPFSIHAPTQVANLTEALTMEENRAEAAVPLRSLVDRIELTPNDQGKLEIDLYGDLASIVSYAANKCRPLEAVKVVARAGNQPCFPLVSARELERTTPFQPAGKVGPPALRRETGLPAGRAC
jgi:hypothetical protein